MHMISFPLFAQAEDNPYLNDLFCVIYDRLATFTQMGAYSLASAERGHSEVCSRPGRVPRRQRVCWLRCAAAVFECEW
jgi:hypothetical protein